MALDSLKVSLGTKAMYYSTHHSQVPKTSTYCTKPPNGINIRNHSPMIPLGGHIWFLEETLLTMDG